MKILKKTLLAGMATLTLASAGATISASQAEAGWRYGHNNYYNHGYQQQYVYHKPYHCHIKKVWRIDHYGYRYLKKIKKCH